VHAKRTKKDFAGMKEKQYLCTGFEKTPYISIRRMPKILKRVGTTNNFYVV